MQWSIFAPPELDSLLNTLVAHTRFLPPGQRNAVLVEETKKALSARLEHLSTSLGDGPFLLGDKFSVADICVGHDIAWAKMLDCLEGFGALSSYLDRLQERPAFQSAYGGPIQRFPDPHAA